MQNNNNVIEIKNLCKNFGDFKVLKDINLNCEKGKIYGIIGHNGSGKTVLLKCICGFYKYDSGCIYINRKKLGKDIDMITNAGLIIEEPAFLRRWDAYHNLDFLYSLNHKSDKEYIFSILEKVGLAPSLKKPVGKFSLGMKQRLAIAQAIMEDPDILLLDEPMNGLDSKGMEEIRKIFLEKKNEGKTILLASHNKDDINILCDTIFLMENGNLMYYK